MQGTMWLQRPGPCIVRQIPPPKCSIDILTIAPCAALGASAAQEWTMGRTKCTGVVHEGSPEVGRKSKEEELSNGDWMNITDAAWPQNKLKMRTASLAGARRVCCRWGRRGAPGALLAGAEPADWGKWLPLCSALVRPRLEYGVCFPKPPPVPGGQGGNCRDATSPFGAARQEDGGNRLKFKGEWFWPDTRGNLKGAVQQWDSNREFLSLEVSKNHLDKTLCCLLWPTLEAGPETPEGPSSLKSPVIWTHFQTRKGRTGWTFKLWCSDVRAAI